MCNKLYRLQSTFSATTIALLPRGIASVAHIRRRFVKRANLSCPANCFTNNNELNLWQSRVELKAFSFRSYRSYSIRGHNTITEYLRRVRWLPGSTAFLHLYENDCQFYEILYNDRAIQQYLNLLLLRCFFIIYYIQLTKSKPFINFYIGSLLKCNKRIYCTTLK